VTGLSGLALLNLGGLLLVVTGAAATTLLVVRGRVLVWRARAEAAEEALARLRAQRRQRRQPGPLDGLFEAAAEAETVLGRAETATTRVLTHELRRWPW
jgi:hypothetical protein